MRSNAMRQPAPSGGEAELAAALEAARGGARERAQELAWQSLRHNPRRESCWLLLTVLVPSREDQEMCLRQVLSINPQHAFARQWFDRVVAAEHPGPLALPFLVETVVPPPAAQPMGPMGKILSLETQAVPTVPSLPTPPEPPSAPTITKTETAELAPPRPRILVVDDSATVRRLVTLALERLGCEVIVASSGIEALGALNHGAPDLVLLDVGLPNLDGHQICRAIKRNERTRGVPVVMLTGRDGLMDRLRGKMAGAAEYLTKPFDARALTAVLKKHLPSLETSGE